MTTNPQPDDEARELMKKYYESLMSQPEEPAKYVTHPKYTEAETRSPEYNTVNRERQRAGLPPISNRQGRRIPFSVALTENEANLLRELAAEWGYMHGGRGNLSAFLAAIALGDLVIAPSYGT